MKASIICSQLAPCLLLRYRHEHRNADPYPPLAMGSTHGRIVPSTPKAIENDLNDASEELEVYGSPGSFVAKEC